VAKRGGRERGRGGEASDRSIEAYREKRDFARTREPAPGPAPSPADGRRGPPVFVVHRHDARNLHYDLRLEMEGVLRSWAVPKGFSYDPRDKHLAVRTEDHPLEYEHFDGVIPKGEYGAGSMTIWDRGTYATVVEPDPAKAVASGELKLLLYGRRLRGEWHMVKTKGGPNHWLLFKSRDRYAGTARDSVLGIDLAAAPGGPMPEAVELARPAPGELFSDPRWLYEAELPGRRVLAEKRGSAVRLRGLAPSPALDGVLADLRETGAEQALLDGVLVALDDRGRPSRALLEERLAGRAPGGLQLYAFDLLYFDEFDLRPLSLLDRKAALRRVLGERPSLVFMDHVLGQGHDLAAASAAAGFEALVAKPVDRPYGEEAGWLRLPLDGQAAGDPEPAGARKRAARARPARVKLSNLGKVFWPVEGYTKGDLVHWYESVAELLLPYLIDRPVHMNRFPDGIEGKSFYQRHAKQDAPEWIPRVAFEGDPELYMLCNERDALVWFANQGSIDLHPWMSRHRTPDSPDYTVIDLDPKQAPFADVVRIARALGKLLVGIGLRPLLKTSGKSGLHVVIPLVEGYGYDQARGFAEAVARIVAREHSDIATVERTLSEREGKVYVDYGQNARGQTVVPPYVVRPVPGATVSMPLEWDELSGELSPSLFTIRTAPARLVERGDRFRALLSDRQELLPAIEALQAQWGSGAR
jgi:bifunctional non-homologous end joining protein LigD